MRVLPAITFGEYLVQFAWVEAAGRTTITRIEAFHQKPDGNAWVDVGLEVEWECLAPGILPQPQPDAIARLNVRFSRDDGQHAEVAVWFDASRFRLILDKVYEVKRLLLFARKPSLEELQNLAQSNAITLEFERLDELGEFLARLTPSSDAP